MEINYRTEFPKLLEHLELTGPAVEIGVAEGRNARVLISSPNITKLYLIDYWGQLVQSGDGGYPQSWHDNNFKETHERVEEWKDKAVFLKGLSTEMLKQIPDDSLILGYIDGDHGFNGCYNDLQNLYPKVKSGGIIAGHDYLNMSYGVNNAVRNFISTYGYSIYDVHITDEDGDKSMVSFWFIKK